MNGGGFDESKAEGSVSQGGSFEVYQRLFADAPHKPVMPREVLELVPESGALKIVDATVGCGGHSSLILKKNSGAVLLGLDRDDGAIEFARQRLAFADGRFRLVTACFSEIGRCAAEMGWLSADIVLMDLGLSSLQLDDPSRGFSYMHDGPLDMRMGRDAGSAASDILNDCSRDELAEIFFRYGEIRRSRKLADEIVAERSREPFTNTARLAEICRRLPGLSRKRGLTAPTLCFQALRVAVNDEMRQLEKGIADAVGLLAPGGVIVVISFNSAEDRIVKNFFREEARDCICPPDFPVCRCGHVRRLEILTRKPLVPKDDEIAANRRAAPARLRAARRTNCSNGANM